ncbi:MAG: hypothetical protein ACPG4T_05095, partial [Nannocystaceae bacterium]
SDDTTSPSERFFHSPGRYVFPDGSVFAESWEELVAGNLMQAPNWTEALEEPSPGTSWSNTLADGTRASATQHCKRWSSKDSEDDGRVGANSLDDDRWSDFEFANPLACAFTEHIYCFEQ